MILSAQSIKDAIGCSLQTAQLYAPHLVEGCEAYGIDTPARLAAFLAQLGHESGSFRYVREIWGPTAAQLTYEGRKSLGNTEPGDGAKYKGHGLIQVTGRFNTAAVRDRLREKFGPLVPDFEGNPELLEQPRWAALSACDYWDSRHLNQLADNGDFEMITRRINGGLNGQAERLSRWSHAKKAFATPTISTISTDVKETTVAPFLLAALPTLLDLIPKLGGIFKGSDPMAERNMKAVEIVVEAAKIAANASNEQDLVEKIKSDPAAAAMVKAAVEAKWLEISEAGGGGIDGARKANAAYSLPDGPRFWFNPAFWISMILLMMPMMLLADVFYVHPESYVGESRTQIVTGILMVIGMVGGYWIGTSMSSQRKTEIAASKE